MGYVRDSLLPDEILFVEGKPHWKALVPASFITVLGAGLVAWFGMWATPVLAVGLLWLGKLWLDRLTTEILVTSRRVIARTGFWKSQTIELEHKNIESFVVEQTPVGRLFNYGTVIVNGLGGASVPLVGLARPGQFRRAALQAEEHLRLGLPQNVLQGALDRLGREWLSQQTEPRQRLENGASAKTRQGSLLEHNQDGVPDND